MRPRIWNVRRQVMGNVIPLVLGVVTGLALFQFDILPRMLLALVMTYLGVNQWGFFENRKIEKELRELTRASGELIGFVYQKPPSAYDAHAEIGLLTVHEDRIDIVSEQGGIILNRDDIVEISRQRNIHSLIGLGGWIQLRLRTGQTFRLESRMYHTMFASKLRTAKLMIDLNRWQKRKSPAEAELFSSEQGSS